MNRFLPILLLYVLFPSKKLRTTHVNKTKGFSWIQYEPSFFDPSEAVNSTEIMPIADELFEVDTKILFGGLLYPMFDGLGTSIPTGKNWRIQFVAFLEKMLIRFHIIKPLFAICLYRKKR